MKSLSKQHLFLFIVLSAVLFPACDKKTGDDRGIPVEYEVLYLNKFSRGHSHSNPPEGTLDFSNYTDTESKEWNGIWVDSEATIARSAAEIDIPGVGEYISEVDFGTHSVLVLMSWCPYPAFRFEFGYYNTDSANHKLVINAMIGGINPAIIVVYGMLLKVPALPEGAVVELERLVNGA